MTDTAVLQMEVTSIVSVATPAPRQIWQDLMERDPDALPYQSPAWTDAACAAGRFVDISRLYETADGRQFVLPLLAPCGVANFLGVAASMPPAWGIGGLVGSSPPSVEVVGAVLDDLRGAGFLSVRIRPNPLHAAVWRASLPGLAVPRRAHVLDLEGGFKTVWEKRFTSRLRGSIRKAEHNVEVEFDATGRLVPQFYALLQKSFRRWARMQHEPEALALWRARRRDPYSKFEVIAARMGAACQIGLASLGGSPVASIIVLRGRNANYIRGAMDADLIGNSGANDLLHKLAIEDAARSGHRYYHMGETAQSASLSQFKEKFGAIAYDYAEYRLERIPLTQIDHAARTAVKRLLGFRDNS